MRNVTLRRFIAALTAVTLLLDPAGVVFAYPKQRKGETGEAFKARTDSFWENRADQTYKWLSSRKNTNDKNRRVKPGQWKGLPRMTKDEATRVLALLTKKHGRGATSVTEEMALRSAIGQREKFNDMIAEGRKSGKSAKRTQDEFWTAWWKSEHGVGTKDDVALANATKQGWWARAGDLISSVSPIRVWRNPGS